MSARAKSRQAMTDPLAGLREQARELAARRADIAAQAGVLAGQADAQRLAATTSAALGDAEAFAAAQATAMGQFRQRRSVLNGVAEVDRELAGLRSEEHTSELQSLR